MHVVIDIKDVGRGCSESSQVFAIGHSHACASVAFSQVQYVASKDTHPGCACCWRSLLLVLLQSICELPDLYVAAITRKGGIQVIAYADPTAPKIEMHHEPPDDRVSGSLGVTASGSARQQVHEGHNEAAVACTRIDSNLS